MKNNSETYPSELFKWIETIPFNKLNSDQKKTVLNYLSEQEYNDMYLAAANMHAASSKVVPKGKEKIKGELLETFNKHHHKKENRIIALTNYPISLGKVAAVAFLFLSIIAWQFFNSNTDERIVYITKTDTLIKEKEIPITEVIHDTFLVHAPQPKRPNKTKSTIVSFSSAPAITDIHIAGTDEMEKTYNRTKNNSLKNDTLVHKYGFVSL